MHQLSVNVAGNGQVVSTPAGIDCGSTCTASFAAGMQVQLTATPATGMQLSAFSGACSGSTCSVILNADTAVTVTFATVNSPPPPTVTHAVTVTVSGTGTVVSTPPGINCPGSCAAHFDDGTRLSLAATPASGMIFSGFSGACSDSTCAIALSGDANVTATFKQTYKMVDLTDHLGGGSPAATKLTRGGDFCGYSIEHADLPPFCFNVRTLTLTPHKELQGYMPTATNGAGVILARKIGIPPGPDVLDDNGTLQVLPVVGAGTQYTGLNDSGDCVGTGEPGDHALLYREQHVTDLGWFGGTGSLGNAINDRGQLAGVVVGSDGRTGTAFIWDGGSISKLPSLGGFFTSPNDINNAGQVAGFGYTPTGSATPQHAFFWNGKTMVDLGALSMLAKGESWAFALNSKGDVVGRGSVGAFLYSRGALSDLNSLADTAGLFLDIAFSISDDGVILVYAYHPAEQSLLLGAPRHLVALYPQ